jgi:hypothetical protein
MASGSPAAELTALILAIDGADDIIDHWSLVAKK